MGRVLTNNLSLAYAIETAIGSLAQATSAVASVTFTTNPADSETVTINGQAYAFESAAIDAAFKVDIGANVSESIDNLVAAINLGAGIGTAYGASTTQHPTVRAYKGAGNILRLVARASGTGGNALTLATTVTGATVSAGTFSGGAASTTGVNPTWKQLEPNTIGQFGATITTVARSPISNARQRRKGAVTDLDSAADFESDLTLDAIEDFVEGFAFARAVHRDLTFRGASVANGAYQVGSDGEFTASQAARLRSGSGVITLLFARGYAQTANNGLKALATAGAANDARLVVSGLTAEDAPSNAVVELAGLRTDDCTWDYTGPTATLTSAADVTNWAVFLTVGQTVHLGRINPAGGFTNGFGASSELGGYARVRAIAANVVTFDKLATTLATDDAIAGTTDIMFGRFVRNVPVSDSSYLERSFQVEATYPNLADPGPGDEYEYSKGNLCNELTIDLPLTDKATLQFAFVGTDTETPTETRKAGASTPRQPSGTSPFNTSADIARLGITETDEDGLTTDFKSLSLTIKNNVSPEKVLGTLGARFMNTGNFEIDIEAQLLFTSSGVVAAIRNNESLTMGFILRNDDGAIAFDIPRLTLGDGSKEFPVNESVLINTTATAYGDPAAPITTSLGVSFLPTVL